MKNNFKYLKSNVQVEPIIDQWYAWPHLIPPATAARNITERHLKIMDSYISAPQIHANAVRNPKMAGGPFIDLGGKKVEEIKALRDRTKRESADMLRLSSALAELDTMLCANATGYSLQHLYQQVPDALRGYVELVYDLNNHPSFRLIEPLLYKSRYYDRTAQGLMLSLTDGDDRPFVLSTPRFESDDVLHVHLPFDHEAVDELFRLKLTPQPYPSISELMNVSVASEDVFKSFLTDEAPKGCDYYGGDGARWRYFGHACVLIETKGISILFDPVISYTYESQTSRYTYQDLPKQIDYVVITHDHQDHVMFETLLQIRHKVKNIVVPRSGGGFLQDPSLKLILQHTGFKNIIELDEMELLPIRGGYIMALPFLGEHADLNIKTKSAYLVRIGKHSLLFAADSCNVEPQLYQHLHREIGDVDALFLGMECDGAPLTWLYGPLLSRRIERAMDESRRLAGSNYEQAIAIVNEFRCREVYVYAMGQEPWLNYVMTLKYTDQSRPIVDSNRLIKECAEKGIRAERLFGEKEIFLD